MPNHRAIVLLGRELMGSIRLRRLLLVGMLAACAPDTPASSFGLGKESSTVDELLPLAHRVHLQENQQYPLGRPTGVLLTPWGDLVVTDPGMRDVKVFDHQGRFRHTLGRIGAGPGEFGTPYSVELTPDSSAVMIGDFSQPRFLVFPRESTTASRTISLIAPGLMIRGVAPWIGDSVLAIGVRNRYQGDTIRDGAVLGPDGTVARELFGRPREFEGKGVAINMSAPALARSNRYAFFVHNLWNGILRIEVRTGAEDTLYLPAAFMTTAILPDTAPRGPRGLTDLSRALPQITQVEALSDSLLVVAVREWDVPNDAAIFRLAVVHWGATPRVTFTPRCDCRLRSVLGDTVVVLSGEVGDSVWVEKRTVAPAGR